MRPRSGIGSQSGSRLKRDFEVLIGTSSGIKIPDREQSDRGLGWICFVVPIGYMPIGTSSGKEKCI